MDGSALTLRYKLFFSFFLMIGLFSILIILIVLATMRETLVQEKFNHLASLASSRAHQIESLLETKAQLLNLVSSRTQLRLSMLAFSKDTDLKHVKKMNRILIDAKKSISVMQHISLINPSGKIVASTDPNKMNLIKTQDTEFIHGQLSETIHNIKFANNLPVISVTSPMHINEKFIGVAWSELIITDLYTIANDKTGLGNKGELLIAGAAKGLGKVMLAPSRQDKSIAFNPKFAEENKSLLRKILESENRLSPQKFITDYKKEKILAISKRVQELNWGVMAKMDLSEVHEPLVHLLNKILIFALLICLPILLLSFWLSHKLTHAVHNAEEETKSIIEAAGDAILLIDKNRQIVGINQAGETIFKCSRDKVIGKPATIFSAPSLRDKYESILKYLYHHSRRAKIGKRFETAGYTSKGDHVPLEISVNRTKLMGQPLLVLICRDISRHKQIEQKNREVLLQQNQLIESQRQFVSTASHEFRTPLSIISNAVQHIERRRADIDENYLLLKTRKIRTAISRMLLLIETTLSYSRIEEGKFILKIVPCDITNLIKDVCSYHQDLTKQHKISCEIKDLPKTIPADPAAIEQILSNLLNNAIKYSPDSDHIMVTARTRENCVEISVSDFGIGIDKKDFSNLFERFFRAETSSGIAGTGLGLHLVRVLSEMHDGKIDVKSEKGKGSTFTLSLPILKSEERNLKSNYAA